MIKNEKKLFQLLQLPVPPPSFFASTGNVPMASASLANAWDLYAPKENTLDIQVIEPEFTDIAGDRMLIEKLSSQSPDFLGLSLYLWNSERSLYIAEKTKEIKPELKIILGGPEVSPDNMSLIENSKWDYAVVGEAEDTFVSMVHLMMEGSRALLELPSLGYRHEGQKIVFNPTGKIDFPLNKYPSPYLTDWIKVDPFRSTYIETVRGCRSKCTYCFYPKSSNTLRGLTLNECRDLFLTLKEKGAKELVFLDPTFNHRPGFEELLDVLIDVNFDGQMKMFAELRAEGLSKNIIKKLKKSGFYRIEIGMQSINKETLSMVQRYGNPEKVAEVGEILVSEGIDLLLDLIVGLPGDKPVDVLRGLHFFSEHGLGDYLQIFPLSVLPGTTMRADAARLGIKYMKTPPYRVFETPNFAIGEISRTLLEAESILNRRIDEVPRPHLIDRHEDHSEYVYLNPSKEIYLEPEFTYRHFQFWIEENSPEKYINLITEKIISLWRKEPFATVDYIFYTDKIPHDSFLMDFRKFLFSAKMNAQKFSLHHRNEDMQHRLIVLLKEKALFNHKEVMQSIEYGYLYQDMTFEKALQYGQDLGIKIPNARIINKNIENNELKKLSNNSDPEAVSFASREIEKIWTVEYLNYGEQD